MWTFRTGPRKAFSGRLGSFSRRIVWSKTKTRVAPVLPRHLANVRHQHETKLAGNVWTHASFSSCSVSG